MLHYIQNCVKIWYYNKRLLMQEFLNYTVFDIKAVDIIIAIAIFFFAYFLKVQMTKIILNNLKILTSKSKTNLDDNLLEILDGPIKYSILVAGFYFAVNWLNIPSFKGIANNIEHTLIIFIIFWTLYRAVHKLSLLVTKFSDKHDRQLNDDVANLIIKFLKVIIVVIGGMTMLDFWGINVSAFLASLGLIGMAFALAAKDTAANLFGSLVILSDKPFAKGDWVLTPDVEGVIESTGVRSTKVRTFAQALVSVPNAVMANSSITNWSRMGKRRIKMRIGLTYSTNTTQVENILKELREMLKKHPDVHQKTIMVHFDQFDSSSLSLFCYFFSNTTVWAQYLAVREDVNLKIMKIVEQNNAHFAFPSQSLYIESMPKNDML